MSHNIDLETVIADSVNDAQLETEEAAVVEDTPEAAEETVEAAPEASDTPAEPVDTGEVASPAAQTTSEPKPQDDFEKLAGVSQVGVGGRENRIPYSRVKKITEKAVSEVFGAVTGRKLNPGEKAVDAVKAHIAKFSDLETKNKEYESTLDNVGKFEDLIANQPDEFLRRLSTLPAYKEFFDFVRQAYTAQQGQLQPGTPTPAQTVSTTDDMPQPDQDLGDGTKVYSMEGLQALLAWRDKQVESRVTKQIEDRYKPIESEWQERRRIEATLPIIRAKIEEARTWPLFNESEDEITVALEQNPNLSLDAAYRLVVFPKLVAERNKVRSDVLSEVSKAPAATSVPVRSTKPVAPPVGNQSIEDIIKAEVDKIKRT